MKSRIYNLLKDVDFDYELYFVKPTEFFPHFRRQAIMQDYYKKLDQIQGKGGIYWATTLLTFETVNNAIEMAEKLVAKYFCDSQ